jgi:hypothetical protein
LRFAKATDGAGLQGRAGQINVFHGAKRSG